jgi:tRNA (guanine10-N2)-methyltransferase
MFDDLLIFSAKHLKLGGRLVVWFPVARDDYTEKLLPKHSALEIVANSEQKLNGEVTRRLITYEKVQASGEIIDVAKLDDIDFRHKYFTQGEGFKQEKRAAAHERNVSEAQKRGKTIQNRTEWKKKSNKKILLDREKSE